MIYSVPVTVTWLPRRADDASTQLSELPAKARVPIDILRFFAFVTGPVASLDCLFQSWGLFQGTSTSDIVNAVFTKAMIRWVVHVTGTCVAFVWVALSC